MKKNKRFLLAATLLAIIFGSAVAFSVGVQAANTVYIAPSGVSYIYNGSNTLTIEGSGVTDDSWKSYQEFIDLNVQNKITTLTVNSTNITEIGDDSFSGCPVLSTVNFSKHNISTIGARAFKDDIAFVKLNGGTSNVANLPNTIRNIEQEAFAGCVKLTTFTLNTLKQTEVTVDKNAFEGDILLKTITFGTDNNVPDKITFGTDAFKDCSCAGMTVTLKTLDLVDNGVFRGKTNLTTITFPVFANVIPANICKDCTGLTTVSSLGNATGVGASAFEGCTALNQVVTNNTITLPITVASIGEKAFYGCNKSTNVTLNIQNKTTDISIGSLAFGDTALTTITIGATGSLNADIADDAFKNAPLKTITFNTKTIGKTKTFAGKTTITTVTFPNNTATIPAGIFKDCTALTTVSSYGNNTTEIGAEAFRNTAIASISLPNKVTKIGDYAFAGCVKLTTFTLNTLKQTEVTVGKNVFEGDILLKTITFGTDNNVPDKIIFGTDTFKDCSCAGMAVTLKTLDLVDNGVFRGKTNLTTITFPVFANVIPANICKGCTGLTTVSSLGNATGVEASAFEGCTSLTTVSNLGKAINIGTNAFKGCTLLNQVGTTGGQIILPATVTSVGDNAFSGCNRTSLATLNIQNNNANIVIGDQAFGNTALKTVTIGAAGSLNADIADDAFNNAPLETVKIYTKTINQTDAFAEKETIKTADLTYNTAAIPTGLFKNCKILATVTYGNNTTEIGAEAFRNTAVTSVSIPNKVTKIGNYAFADCIKLTTFTLNTIATTENVSVGDKALENCPLLKTITFGTNATGPQNITLGQDLLEGSNVAGMTVTINSLKLIDNGVFKGKTNLTTITFPYYTDVIPANICKDCTGLTKVTSLGKATGIGASAFEGCTMLSNVAQNSNKENAIPNTVINIGNNAFNGTAIANLFLQSVSATENITLENKAFANIPTLKTMWLGTDKTGPKNLTLAADVFEGSDAITTVQIRTLNIIGNSTFKNKPALTSITFPYYTNIIPESICENCTALTTVNSLGSATGIGINAFKGCVLLNQVGGSAGQIILPATVTSVGDNAFTGCSKSTLTTLNIQNKTTDISIGSLAFSDTALKTITIGATGSLNASIPDNAFDNAPLTSITINTKTISKTNAFAERSTITTVNMPNITGFVPESIFKNCTALTTVSSIGKATGVGANAFEGCILLNQVGGTAGQIILPATVTSIGNSAFSGCNRSSLATLNIQNNNTDIIIGDQAFGDTALKTVTIGATGSLNADIADDAFSTAPLTSVTINTKTIDKTNAFAECPTITTVSMPNISGSLPEGIFKDCTALTTISSLGKATGIGNSAFEGCIALHRVGGTNNTIAIPATVLNIGDSAFEGVKVTTLSLATGLQTIGNEAFKDCKSLSAITIPNTTTVIGARAFEGCSAAKTLLINTVAATENVSVGNRAFGDCTLLSTITLGTAKTGSQNIALPSDAFEGCTAANMNVTVNTLNLTAEGLFQNKDNLVTITFPYYTGAIPAYLCKDCTGLTKVASLGNATFIGAHAFEGCSSLSAKWNEVEMGEDAIAGSGVWFQKNYDSDLNFMNFYDEEGQESFIYINENTEFEVVGLTYKPAGSYINNEYYYLPEKFDPNQYVLMKNAGVINGHICDVKMIAYATKAEGQNQEILLRKGSINSVKLVHRGGYTAAQVYVEIHFYKSGTDFTEEVEFNGVLKGTGMVREVAGSRFDAGYYGGGDQSQHSCDHYSVMGVKTDQVQSVYITKDKKSKVRFAQITSSSSYSEYMPVASSSHTLTQWNYNSGYICYRSDILFQQWYDKVKNVHNDVMEYDRTDPGHALFFKVHSTPDNPLKIYGDITCDGMELNYITSGTYDPIPTVFTADKEALYEVTRGRAGTGTAALIKNGGTDDYLPILSLKGGDTTEIVPDEQDACSIFKEEKNINAAREIFDDISGGLTATLGGGKTEILGVSDNLAHTWYTGNKHLDFKTSDGKDAFIEFCKTTIELKEADNVQDGIKPSIVPAIRLDYNNGEDPDWHNDLVFYTNDAQELSIPEDEDFIGWNTKYNGKGDWYGSEAYEENGQTKRRAKESSLTMDEANTISEKQNTNIGVLYAIYRNKDKIFTIHSNYIQQPSEGN